MMGLLDGPFRSLATTLITTLGASATYQRKNPGTVNVATGEFFGNTTTSLAVRISPPEQYRQEQIDWTAPNGRFSADVRKTFKIVMAAAGFTLSPDPTPAEDYILVAGTTYRVVMISPIYSGDQVAAYELMCRL